MSNVGFATLSVIPSFNGFQNRLERGTTPGLTRAGVLGGSKFGDAAGKSAGARFGSVFKTAAKATLIGVAGAGALAVKFGSDAIGSASELNESLNAVNVTYGKQAKAVQQLGRQSAKALGLSNSEFNSLSVRFSAFSKTIAGGNGKKVVSTLDDLTGRASDFASVMNLEVSEAAGLFQSGLAGESEPLRRFGIDLSAASVEAFAYANGIAESGAKLTEAQKVQARYGSIMEQTAKTQGDFKNTSGELANQQRILSARWEDGKAKLGKGLLPIMSDAADFLLDKGIPAFEDFSDWFTKKGIPAFKKFADEQGPRAIAVFEGIRDFAQDAKPFAEGIVKAFDDMPPWAKKVLVGGVIGGTVAVKLGGAELFKRGATPLNPLFVSAVGGGLDGPGGKAGFLNKLGIFGAILAPAAVGLNELHDFHRGDDKNALAGLGRGGINEFLDDKLPTWLGGDGRQKVEEFNRKLSDTQAAFATSKAAANDYFMFIKNGHPTEASTRFTVTGIDTAKAELQSYLDLLARVSAHVDSRLDAAGGSGPTTPSGKGGGSATRGVNVNYNGPINVNGTRELERVGITKAHQAALGGFGS